MVLGDSVALSLEPGLDEVGREQGLIGWNRAALGCGFVPVDKAIDSEWKLSKEQADRCKEWYTTWQQDVETFRPTSSSGCSAAPTTWTTWWTDARWRPARRSRTPTFRTRCSGRSTC